MRYLIKLSYNGSCLSGWQSQKNAPSVQEETEKALSILFAEKISVTGAGRTDAKVNAVSYIAHFDVSDGKTFDAAHISYKLNAMLPKSIVVHEIIPAGQDFHARFSAASREYHYFLHRKKDPFMTSFSYHCHYDLDMEKMNEAASYLLGEHDFSCFEKTGGSNATSICTVFEAQWQEYVPSHVGIMGYPHDTGDYLVFRIRANRFLRNMVRAIVGTLIDIGRGKAAPDSIKQLIASRNRSNAGESVPGNALFFSGAEY